VAKTSKDLVPQLHGNSSLTSFNTVKVRSPEATEVGKLIKIRSEVLILGNSAENPSLITS
jgi:hypothetical protein